MSAIQQPQKQVEDLIADGYDAVYRYAYVLTGNCGEAEDLTQETIVKTLIQSRKSTGIDNATAYMMRVVLHEFFRSRKRSARLRHAERRAEEEHNKSLVDSHTYDLISALEILSPRERAAIVARYYLNLPEREVAEVMKCSPGTVKQFTSRALKKLRENNFSSDSAIGRNVRANVAVNR